MHTGNCDLTGVAILVLVQKYNNEQHKVLSVTYCQHFIF